MRGRALLLVLSVFVAAVGTGLIYAYVRSADNRAIGDNHGVRVIVSGVDAPAGTVISALSPGIRVLPRIGLPKDALILPAGQQAFDTLAKAGGITQIAIHKDDPLQASYFTSSSSASTTTGGSKNVAVSIAISGAPAGVGLLQVGHRAMVFVTIKGTRPTTKVLLPNAMVIGINGSDGAASDDAARTTTTQPAAGTQGTVWLSVPIKDVQKVILVQADTNQFSIYFGLPGAEVPTSGNLGSASVQDLS